MDKIEPHIILHLRINKNEINSYLENKIQINDFKKDEKVKSLVYDANNLDLFKASYKSNPTPANLNDNSQFGVFNLNNTPDTKSFDTKLKRVDKKINKKLVYKKVENKEYCYEVSHINLDKQKNIPEVDVDDDENCSDVKIKLIKALGDFADSNKRKEWLKSTSIWCRWCSHPFQGPPVSIPKWYINKTFFVSGCYCSYSCAASHLFSKNDINETNKWKYYNLLHHLKKKILKLKETKRIQLAPPQETLKVFGGHLSIDQFRAITNDSHKYYNTYSILEPPMVSISSVIEETIQPKNNMSDMRMLNAPGGVRSYGNMKYIEPKNKNSISSDWKNSKSYIPIDNDRMKRAVENLKVKRKAPLIDKKKTLLHYMKLKINKR
jgi:hypothetical protein